MAKKKAAKKAEPGIPDSAPEADIFDPYVGGEDDDLSDMAYVQDENTTTRVETQPPETKEEAELMKQAQPDPTPVDDKGDEVEASDEDEEEEAEEVAEAEAEAPVVAEEEEDTPKIPKDRFDEVNSRMKKAEENNEKLRKQLEALVDAKEKKPEPEAPPYDYDAKEAEAMDAMLEGDAEKYKRIRAEIRAAEKADYVSEAAKLAHKGDDGVRETLEFEEAGARIERAFPQFAEGTDVYNPEARQDLLDLYIGYAQSGKYSRAEALEMAAERATRIYGFGAEEAPADPAPDNVIKMKPADPKKKAAVSKKQPPTMEGSSEGSEEPRMDISSMSDEEFDALPESTKRRARGDIL